MTTINLNCDLGEGGKYDALLMPFLSSCNIACGGHYGTAESVRTAVELAKQHHVQVGAHPSYPDLDNFGRQSMSLPFQDLKQSLHHQIDLVEEACQLYEVNLHHIKPHGALYNDMRKSPELVNLVLEVIQERNKDLVLFSPPRVNFQNDSPDLIPIWIEGFADRTYQNDLNLVPRTQKNAVLHDPDLISKTVFNMIKHQKVKSISGEEINQKFDTICVHSDTPNAYEILKTLTSQLSKNGIKIDRVG